MRADAVDVEISDHRLRLICKDPVGLEVLRSALQAHLVDEPAPAAFEVRTPQQDGGLFVLLDRSGFVLARARDLLECIGVLGGFLAGFRPPATDSVRVHLRAVADDDGTVLGRFPLMTSPPLIERRLTRLGYRVVDRLAVDMTLDGRLSGPPVPWPGLLELPLPDGHLSIDRSPEAVKAVLVPRVGPVTPSQAQIVAFIAENIDTTDRNAALDLAELLASRADSIQFDDPNAVYDNLRSMD